jgi:hypothetical protein
MSAQFMVASEVLSAEDGHPIYSEVMQDICVDKTGRFEMLSTKTSIDPQTGAVLVTFEYLDHGPQDDKPIRY